MSTACLMVLPITKQQSPSTSAPYDITPPSAHRLHRRHCAMTASSKTSADETTPLNPTLFPSPGTYTIDGALERLSMGRYQYFLIFLTGLSWTAESMEMMLLSFIKQPLQCQWRISDASAALITTAVGLGMLVGSFVFGRVADRYGRKPAFQLCTLTTFAFGIASALAPSYPALLAARALVGFGVGGLPVSFTFLLELLPVSRRGRWGMVIALFWALGSIFEAAVALLVLPRFGWRWLIVTSSLPLLLVVLLSFPLLESPRWLLAQGRTAEAEDVLCRLAQLQRRPTPTGYLVADDNEGVTGGSTRDLFLPNVRRVTAMVFVLWWAAAFTYYGIVMLQPELLAMENVGARCSYAAEECASRRNDAQCADDSRCEWLGDVERCEMLTALRSRMGKGDDGVNQLSVCKNRLRRDDFVSTLWGALGEVPGIVSCLLVIDIIGRKAVMMIWFGVTSVCLLLLVRCTSRAMETALFFVGRGVSEGAFHAVYMYTTELYPTAVRATAMGVSSAVARTGLMAAPLVAQVVVGVSERSAIGAFFAVGVAAVVTAGALRLETRGRRLLSSMDEFVKLLKLTRRQAEN
eukprot:TRINITY_DN3873_c0_g1_i1.p1 TRINITY_DN3873_c0_g1~~TRINITY_DN3873_c0_g1_i1.p1  ORF type:complete len:578 (+),score=80.37 TRINITY_DN3873_c0_g1_i1:177-1910(+)